MTMEELAGSDVYSNRVLRSLAKWGVERRYWFENLANTRLYFLKVDTLLIFNDPYEEQ